MTVWGKIVGCIGGYVLGFAIGLKIDAFGRFEQAEVGMLIGVLAGEAFDYWRDRRRADAMRASGRRPGGPMRLHDHKWRLGPDDRVSRIAGVPLPENPVECAPRRVAGDALGAFHLGQPSPLPILANLLHCAIYWRIECLVDDFEMFGYSG